MTGGRGPHLACLHLHFFLQFLVLVFHRVRFGDDRARLLQLRLVLLDLIVKPVIHREPSHMPLSDLRVTLQSNPHPFESSSCLLSAARSRQPMCPFPPSSATRAPLEFSSTSSAFRYTLLLDSHNPDSAGIAGESLRISARSSRRVAGVPAAVPRRRQKHLLPLPAVDRPFYSFELLHRTVLTSESRWQPHTQVVIHLERSFVGFLLVVFSRISFPRQLLHKHDSFLE